MKWPILVLLIPAVSFATDKTLTQNRSATGDVQNHSENKGKFKYLNDIIAKTSPDDFNDMEKLLMQLSFVPAHKDPATGTQLFKVTMVKKGSIFEKAGLKVGDLIANGNSPN